MTYKSLLVHVEADPAQSVRLQCAGDLANEFEATVIGLGAETIAPLSIGVSEAYAAAEAAWMAARREQITENLKSAEANFDRVMGSRPHEWRTAWSAPTGAMARAARAADLIVVGKPQPGLLDPSRSVDVGQLVITAGRPVLLCPTRGERLSPRSALVAWKDTRESRRALADALPLLQRAESVLILEVCPPSDLEHATARTLDVAGALARHGVTAEARAVAKGASTTETLMDAADAMGAALIVAGGYGHSRIGEWAFGGVTKALLKQDHRFVLFSH